MCSKEDIQSIVNNCNSIAELFKYVRIIKRFNVEYGQPLHNIEYISLKRVNELNF